MSQSRAVFSIGLKRLSALNMVISTLRGVRCSRYERVSDRFLCGLFHEPVKAWGQIKGYGQKPVGNGFPQRGLNADMFHRRWIDVAPDREIKGFIRHKLMELFHAARGTGLDLERDHLIPVLQEVVNLSLPPPGPLPVEKGRLCKRALQHAQLLAHKLLCQTAFV